MSEEKGIKQRFAAFTPSKTLWFWSCVGCVVATMIIGFTVGGWVTGGTAQKMAADAANEARAQLVAGACVENFVASPEFPDRLAKLKDTRSWARPDMLGEGGWVTLAGMERPLTAAARICADRLAAMEVPVASASDKDAPVAQ